MNNDVVAFDFENERFEMRTYVPYEEKHGVAIEYAARITYIDESLGVVTTHMDEYAASRKLLVETYLVGEGKQKIENMTLADFMDNYSSILDVMMNVRSDIKEDIEVIEWMKDDCIRATKEIDEAKVSLSMKLDSIVAIMNSVNDYLNTYGETTELTNRIIEITKPIDGADEKNPVKGIKHGNILNFSKKE